MESNLLTLEQVHIYLLESGAKVKNRDIVRHFKSYLTDPLTKEENRSRFKSYINTLAQTKNEGTDKVIFLKPKYCSSDQPQSGVLYSPQNDPRNSLDIPLSPVVLGSMDSSFSSPSRQPPPYRPPPPPPNGFSSTTSLDTISFGSMTSLNDVQKTPQPPPREKKRDSEKNDTSDVTPQKTNADADLGAEDKTVSVKERTQKFNRLASVEDDLSPRQTKSAEKNKIRGADEDDGVSLTPVDPKKCVEWYVTASRGDYQELLKLANTEPRLVNKKDPFTAYTVLHWGAKYGNAEIIKVFAGRYKVDVNGKTNGGYTPLHISAQFGHKDVFKLLIEVYKADPNIRDYSGRTAEYYFLVKEQKEGQGVVLRKIKGRKKQSDKDLGFLRIGSLNVRVKKTTEAFSNFLGVGSASVSPMDSFNEKVLKGWGSADNVSKEASANLKIHGSKKKYKRGFESGGNSTPGTPKTPTKSFNSFHYDSDSDTAAGFDSNWKH